MLLVFFSCPVFFVGHFLWFGGVLFTPFLFLSHNKFDNLLPFRIRSSEAQKERDEAEHVGCTFHGRQEEVMVCSVCSVCFSWVTRRGDGLQCVFCVLFMGDKKR